MDTATAQLPDGKFEIGKTFTFEAGHRLTGLPPEHKCSRQHGHSYTVEIILTATTLQAPGFVTDFADLDPVKQFLDRTLDHHNLPDVLPIEPTSELLAQYLAGWFLQHVEPTIHGELIAVRVRETGRSWAQFTVDRP
ncbi:6-carboxytetrahydropterin synthase QueD [Amycolatopsis thailandensis]|uniref:6-carboxy-5,6,7,8-tetrahydropterin synthase n=1 Tax=Amycolatopsis thailandensis TaxID=589330 RepID=A0A229RUF0_9PSEU|nr:6-carboxytetrahydropterin synthase [Amycolatopsis thailandensis]OXM50280.1 6-carboxytetrahydropterin synthase QueD [Amycolatopsis thailandensis]